MAGRIYSHYTETYKKVIREKESASFKFFADNAGELVVLWRPIEQDRLCITVEEMVEESNPSKFEKEYPRQKRKLNNK